MQVITTVSFKGGVGKTTILMALASAAADQGKRVLLIDTDQNGPMTEWKATGEKNDYWTPNVAVESHLAFDALHNSVTTHDNAGDIDLLLIDSKGGRSEFHNALVQIVDLALVPTRPLKVDADQVITTLKWLQKMNSDGIETAPALVVFSAIKAPSQLSPDMIQIRDALMRVPHMEAQVPERLTFNNMQSRGLLPEIARSYASDPDPLVRGQARPYQNAMVICSGLLDEVTRRIDSAEYEAA